MNERIVADVSDSLSHLGYKPSDEKSVKLILGDAKRFSSIVSWLSKELHILTQSSVDIIASLEESCPESFGIEVSSVLRALHCPNKRLMSGDVSERLNTDEKKLLLLDFLATEAQAARMSCPDKEEKRMRIEVRSSPQARDASLLLKHLNMAPPPATVTLAVFFKKIEEKIHALKPTKQQPLLNQALTPRQWTSIEQVYHRLIKDFTVRRMVLIKRVDVTVQSFRWSSRMKDKQNDLTQVYMPIRQELSVEPTVQLGDILAARPDITIEEKTSCQHVLRNTQTSLTKIIIGPVPDRGGRSAEMQPPPPEMPSWSKRQEPRNHMGGRGRSAGRGGEGGGFNQTKSFNQGGGYSQSGTGYNQDGGDRSYGQGGGGCGNYNPGGDRSRYTQDDRFSGEQGGRGRGYNQGNDYQGGYYNQCSYGSGGAQNYNQRSGHRQSNEREYVSGRIQDAGWDDTRRNDRGGSHRGGYRGGGGRY